MISTNPAEPAYAISKPLHRMTLPLRPILRVIPLPPRITQNAKQTQHPARLYPIADTGHPTPTRTPARQRTRHLAPSASRHPEPPTAFPSPSLGAQAKRTQTWVSQATCIKTNPIAAGNDESG